MKSAFIVLLAASACSCARSDDVEVNGQEDTQLIEPAEAPFGVDGGFSSNSDEGCSSAACSNRTGN